MIDPNYDNVLAALTTAVIGITIVLITVGAYAAWHIGVVR